MIDLPIPQDKLYSVIIICLFFIDGSFYVSVNGFITIVTARRCGVAFSYEDSRWVKLYKRRPFSENRRKIYDGERKKASAMVIEEMVMH